MDIDMDRNGDSLKIIIDGNIDATGGPKLAAALQEAMGMQGLKDVVFNLAMVRTISSSGIGKLMNFFKYMTGKKARCESRAYPISCTSNSWRYISIGYSRWRGKGAAP